MKYLLSQGQKVAILENDFGAVNVDMMLLKDLESDNCSLEMISGGCDYDCHVRRFKTKLIALFMTGFDRVIVEPSGIYDPDEFFDVLREDPICDHYEIGSVITILDGHLEADLSKESRYLMASQLANSGKLIISKIKKGESYDLKPMTDRVNGCLAEFKSDRTFTPDSVLAKDWDSLSDSDYSEIAGAGYVTGDHVKLWFDDRSTFKSLYFMNKVMPVSKLKDKIKELFRNPEAGHIFRIKGFMPENGKWYEINATRENLLITEIPEGQEILIVIGEGLNEDHINKLIDQGN